MSGTDPPQSPQQLLQAAQQSLDGDELEAALGQVNQAIALDGSDPAAFFLRGRILFRQRDYGAAFEDFDWVERLGGWTAELSRHRARCGFHVNYPDDWLADAERVLREEPDDLECLFLRGAALESLARWEEAIEVCTAVIERDPRHGLAYYNRGLSHFNLGNEDAALADYRAAIEGRGIDANSLHQLAHTLERNGHLDLGLRAFDAAVAADPDQARHHNCRANLCQSMGLEEEAERSHRAAEAIHEQEGHSTMNPNRYMIYEQVQAHFGGAPLETIDVTERRFPFRAAPETQVAFERLGEAGVEVQHFHATEHGHQSVTHFSEVYEIDRRNPVRPVNPKYEEFDIGEDEPLRCLMNGVWLLSYEGTPAVLILDTTDWRGLRLEVAAPHGEEGARATRAVFDHIEATVRAGRCYRGKVLSLEQKEMYSGHNNNAIMVHRLREVPRDDVILPSATLDMLDRNVIPFARQRERLKAFGLSVKKGLLFFGPPGTGKTHTLHYLASSMADHTMFLISAEQVGCLDEYMTLARLLEPSIVVIEDVDLIARERQDMRSIGEEVMLNKLLNEMDGLKEDAAILFVLTTNHPDSLEDALAARPGRIDQAIEFPLPDDAGRAKLTNLYAMGLAVSEEVVAHVVARTQGVSASFIKELMRRAIQFALESDGECTMIARPHVDRALTELLEGGGRLNRKLLGADRHVGFTRPADK